MMVAKRRAEAKRLYLDEGYTVNALVDHFNSYSQLVKVDLKNCGVKLRPEKPRNYPLFDREKLVELYSKEMRTLEEVRKLLGIGRQAALTALIEEGIPIRRHGQLVAILASMKVGESKVFPKADRVNQHTIFSNAGKRNGWKFSLRVRGSQVIVTRTQ